MKSTGDVSSENPGFAKASPFFQKLDELKPKSKAEEKKVIAEASKPVSKPARDQKDEDNEAE